MYYRNRENVENLRVRANNCFIALDSFSLEDLKNTALNYYACSSVLRNIILQEISNFEELIDFLKRILVYEVKILERELVVATNETKISNLEKEIATLLPKLVLNDVTFDESLKKEIDLKTQEMNHLKSDNESSRMVIENMKSAFTSYHVPEGMTSLSVGTYISSSIEVDTSILESSLNYVKYVRDSFKREAYDPYITSDLTEFFEGYAYQIDIAYKKVLDCLDRLYLNIETYINDSNAVERALYKKLRVGSLRNSDIAVIINKLPDLEDYNMAFEHLMEHANYNLKKEKKISMDKSSKVNKEKALEESIEESGGLGHREAVVAAATYLSENEKVPYFHGGSSNKEGLNEDWGKDMKISTRGSKEQPNGSYAPYGLDAKGFIEWALNNGGYHISIKDIDSLVPLGEKLKFSSKNLCSKDVQAGDLLYKKGKHVAIITDIDKHENKIKIALEKNPEEGMVVIKSDIDDFVDNNDYDAIILMEKYYQDENNYREGINNEN